MFPLLLPLIIPQANAPLVLLAVKVRLFKTLARDALLGRGLLPAMASPFLLVCSSPPSPLAEVALLFAIAKSNTLVRRLRLPSAPMTLRLFRSLQSAEARQSPAKTKFLELAVLLVWVISPLFLLAMATARAQARVLHAYLLRLLPGISLPTVNPHAFGPPKASPEKPIRQRLLLPRFLPARPPLVQLPLMSTEELATSPLPTVAPAVLLVVATVKANPLGVPVLIIIPAIDGAQAVVLAIAQAPPNPIAVILADAVFDGQTYRFLSLLPLLIRPSIVAAISSALLLPLVMIVSIARIAPLHAQFAVPLLTLSIAQANAPLVLLRAKANLFVGTKSMAPGVLVLIPVALKIPLLAETLIPSVDTLLVGPMTQWNASPGELKTAVLPGHANAPLTRKLLVVLQLRSVAQWPINEMVGAAVLVLSVLHRRMQAPGPRPSLMTPLLASVSVLALPFSSLAIFVFPSMAAMAQSPVGLPLCVRIPMSMTVLFAQLALQAQLVVVGRPLRT